ncbi:hypothetical protein THAOC_14711 [Thalassiosira oceanica]|uniref:Uncharacterized protein n=1 Tax=Thalassiosira oceanica TaxID=159749 RepID=K0T252_THAOC|nr:hypothetical protein THAOC_14711 [Thalassiosira oceanica]|eukprot:EJK64547.1 hypothetical protein THAOC_14711 [Thalassiosira oceanica]
MEARRTNTGASCVGPGPPGGSLPYGGCTLPFVRANVRSTGLVRLSATVRLHALVGKKDGHAFAPNGRNETRHWMPGPVRIGSDSLTTVLSVYVIIC